MKFPGRALKQLPLEKKAQILAWGVALILGGIQAVASRYVVNPDGISYLSLGDLYARGSWGSAVNGYWSPVYPLLLGMTRFLFRVPRAAEVPAAHVVGFVAFLISLAAFQFFLAELRVFL